MDGIEHVVMLRVRYSETDQGGTFYNSRALEWFEVGRTELLRGMGMSYAQMEERGLFLPLVEAHVKYQGRVRYDEELKITSRMAMAGKASVRFEVAIVKAEGEQRVCEGWTVHAMADGAGKAQRCPGWFTELMEGAKGRVDGKARGAEGAEVRPGDVGTWE